MPRGGARQGAGRPKGQGQFGESTKPMRVPESLVEDIKKFITQRGVQIPLYSCGVSAGFPSPADDHIEQTLDLNEYLIKHPAATFFVRAKGDSMIEAGIFENDILIVDRSLEPTHGSIIIAAIDGELTVKRLFKKNNQVLLMPENKKYKPIEISPSSDNSIWGVVCHVLHSVG